AFQCREIQRPERDRKNPRGRHSQRRRRDRRLCSGQWGGFRSEVSRQVVRRVSASAQFRSVRGNRHRTGKRPENRPTPWRPRLGPESARLWRHVLFLSPCQGGRMNAVIRTILLAEDNANDVTLTLAALRKNNLVNEVVVVRDGAEALDFLYRRGGYRDRPGD